MSSASFFNGEEKLCSKRERGRCRLSSVLPREHFLPSQKGEKMLTLGDLFKRIKEHTVEVVDLKFADLPGNWQHLSLPGHLLNERLFEEGIGFDGSSIRGFQDVNNSDMLLKP